MNEFWQRLWQKWHIFAYAYSRQYAKDMSNDDTSNFRSVVALRSRTPTSTEASCTENSALARALR